MMCPIKVYVHPDTLLNIVDVAVEISSKAPEANSLLLSVACDIIKIAHAINGRLLPENRQELKPSKKKIIASFSVIFANEDDANYFLTALDTL